MENITKTTKLFIDTCSILHPKAEHFLFNELQPLLKENNQKIIIPQKVISEINRLLKHKDVETRKAAEKGATILKRYIRQQLVDIRGEESDPFSDNLFLHIFMKFRTKYHLALVTQDVKLSKDIRAIEDIKSVNSSKTITVLKLDKDGKAVPWQWNRSRQNRPSIGGRSSSRPIKFKRCSDPRRAQENVLEVSKLPAENDIVKSPLLGDIKLIRRIGNGGEGAIYVTDQGLVCKIYHLGKATDLKYQKIKLMLRNRLNIPGVCWPIDITNNDKDKFVGYVMPEAKGEPMQTAMFIKPLLQENFPHWHRSHLVQLAMTILEKINTLNHHNVIIGDINPHNILIQSESEVYFVDTDSYQIEDFPCSVGTVNYTAPEIQKKRFETFLRTHEHERFAIATLLFMILLPGKPPYSHQGGGNPQDNIKKGEFSYPLGDQSNKKTPDGPWKFIWSNLPFKIKSAFFNCFNNGERLSALEWLKLMRAYSSDLENGWVSNELFPVKYKSVSEHAKTEYGAEEGFVELKCDKCGIVFTVSTETSQETDTKMGVYCRECWRVLNTEGEKVICCDCKQPFLFSLYEQKQYKLRKFSKPKRCKECRDKLVVVKCLECGTESKVIPEKASKYEYCPQCWHKRQNTGQKIKCTICNQSFLFSLNEQDFFEKKGYELPKKCKSCRKASSDGTQKSKNLENVSVKPIPRRRKGIFESLFGGFLD